MQRLQHSVNGASVRLLFQLENPISTLPTLTRANLRSLCVQAVQNATQKIQQLLSKVCQFSNAHIFSNLTRMLLLEPQTTTAAHIIMAPPVLPMQHNSGYGIDPQVIREGINASQWQSISK
jgi:hypothetical protein